MFHQWRIVFERSDGAALVHDADGEDGDVGIPEDGWRFCDVAERCEDDDTLRVTGELHSIYKTDTNHGYFSRKTPAHFKVQQYWTNSKEVS